MGGITECPLAPGRTKTYEFVATQYGTGWYHSHLSVQLAEGAYGATVIHGPASLDYDEDLGPVLIADWYHEPAFALWERVQRTGAPPIADTALINGLNVFGAGGRRWTAPVEHGKRYRLRLVNAGVDNHFRVSLDGHRFWVIANDHVPVVPFETVSINLGAGTLRWIPPRYMCSRLKKANATTLYLPLISRSQTTGSARSHSSPAASRRAQTTSAPSSITPAPAMVRPAAPRTTPAPRPAATRRATPWSRSWPSTCRRRRATWGRARTPPTTT